MMKKNILLTTVLNIAVCISILFSTLGYAQSCPVAKNTLTERDLEIARVAWKYIENNVNLETGLVNAVNNYPSTTMWDTGSAMAGIITAREVGIISQEKMDAMISQMLTTLLHLPYFDGELPNKVYHTKEATMVNYANKASIKGIGVSSLDLGRLASWLNILSCLHPHHKELAKKILESWNYCLMIRKGQMYGLAWNEGKTKPILLQEGRLGYEQYAGKVFKMMGFNQSISAHYKNKFTTSVKIEDIPILIDKRDAMTLGANNYVVAESYAMDAKEHGFDDENSLIIDNIYRVQEARWKRTGIVTAVSEDNVDRRPYFVYNTIYTNGEAWAAITDMGEDYEEMKSTSTKAALSMAYLYPNRPYSKVLLDKMFNARNPAGGWYSGIYEDHKGFNKATSANTNGVIMSLLLSKKYGPLNRVCTACNKGVRLHQSTIASVNDLATCAESRPARVAKHDERVKKGQEIIKKNTVIALRIYRERAITKISDMSRSIAKLETLVKAGKGAQASSELKKFKKSIWNFSNQFKTEKKSFLRLMGTVDSISGAWSGGKTISSKELQDKLNAIVARLKTAT